MRRTFQSHSRKTHAGNLYSVYFKARYMPPVLDSSPVLELNGSMELITKGTNRRKWSLRRSLCYKFKSLNSRPNLHRCLDYDFCMVQRGHRRWRNRAHKVGVSGYTPEIMSWPLTLLAQPSEFFSPKYSLEIYLIRPLCVVSPHL